MTRALFVVFLVAVLLAFGCRNSRSELVEAELRTRERELNELRAEVQRLEMLNHVFSATLPLVPGGVQPGMPAAASPITELSIGRGTGGVNDDCLPGDEALMVVVVPKDCDGNAVKVVGVLQIAAEEITSQGMKVPLSTWDFPTDQVARSWKQGLIGSGFNLTMPWKVYPTNEKLRVIARMTLTNGQQFEAERDISIRPVPANLRTTPPPTPPGATVPSAPATVPEQLGPPNPATATEGPELSLLGAVRMMRPVHGTLSEQTVPTLLPPTAERAPMPREL